MALLAHERVDEQLQPDRERERLVRLIAAEGDELLLLGEARDDVPQVTAPIETSTTTGSPPELGIPMASGFVPASFAPPDGWPRRRGEGRSARRRARPRQAADVVPSIPVGKVRSQTTSRA